MKKKIFQIFILFVFVFAIVYLVDYYQQKQINDDPSKNLTQNKNVRSIISKKNSKDYIEKLNKISVENEEIPLPEGMKRVAFNWKYAGEEYFLEDTLYNSTYLFYTSQPKVFKYVGELPANWEEEYYGIFLKYAKNDNSIKDFALKLRNIADKNHFSDNQLAELTVNFVQSITYDDQKARDIAQKKENIKPRYPYEVLFEKSGVCSGKSFLLVALLRELGFGSALIEYDNENHMAVGIQCPVAYSVDSSGFCYIETTSKGHKIGIIPQLDLSNNVAIPKEEMGHYEDSQESKEMVKPSNGKIYQKKFGTVYSGVEKTLTTIKEIEEKEKEIIELKSQLNASKNDVDQVKKEINDLDKKLKKFEQEENNKEYNKLVPEFNALIQKEKDEIRKYNELVKTYNIKVDSYNTIIKNF